jgi:tetraacyldisaccharide 4'-kinase
MAGAEMLLMDDGFQNPSLKKSVSLLVVDGEAGFGNGHVIPAGPLREAIGRGFKRADALIVMGSPSKRTSRQLASWTGPVFRARLTPPPTGVFGRYIAFAGIGRPEKFFETLATTGATIVERIAFPDHHPFSEAEIAGLIARAKSASARLITTAKDHVRLRAGARAAIEILPVAACFEPRERFGSFLMERLASARQSPTIPAPQSSE